MASPMDIPAAAAGMVSLSFQIFQGCVQGYRFIRTAQAIGRDGDFLRARLLFEQIRLEEWARRAGLDESSLGNHRLNWGLISQILEQIKWILTSAELLKQRYGLDVEVVQENETGVGDESSTPSPIERERGIEKFFTRLRPGNLTKYAQRIQSSSGTLRRIRWAAVGKDDTCRVVSELGILNDQLLQLLELSDSARVQEWLDRLLREVLSLCVQPAEVETLKHLLSSGLTPHHSSLAAAAALKNIRLMIGVDKRDDELRQSNHNSDVKKLPRLTVLKEKKLVLDITITRKGMSLAIYNRFPVLVQWKEVTSTTWDRYDKHMKRLALLLSNASEESFHCLPCLGLLPSPEKQCFGLVYDIPSRSDAESISKWTMLSLYDAFEAIPKLSLSRRLNIARSMAQAVLQLHTAGWLHKAIHSRHIVFLAREGTTSGDIVNTPPYLVGYEHARPDTETAGTELIHTLIETDLYRHPDCRGPDRDRYEKRFDVYALGCLLVEIALWAKLLDIHSRYGTKDWNTIIADAETNNTAVDVPVLADLLDNKLFANDITHSAGDVFWSAVKMCLSMKENLTVDEQALLGVQHVVLKKLKDCNVGDQY